MLRRCLLTKGTYPEAATLSLALQDDLTQARAGSFSSSAWKQLDLKGSQGHTAPVTTEAKGGGRR